MKKSAVLVFALFVMLIGCAPTLACVCELPLKRVSLKTAVSKAKADAAVVFSGKVIEIDEATVKFSVEGLWKGAPAHEIIMANGAGGSIVSDCAYRFELGEEYLVYASGSGAELGTNKCSRTRPLGSASAEIEVLEKLKAKQSKRSSIQNQSKASRG
jgi:hypothetical protein